MLTIPNATPVKAVWYSKLGVGSSGFGYAKSNKKLSADQKDVTARKVKSQVLRTKRHIQPYKVIIDISTSSAISVFRFFI